MCINPRELKLSDAPMYDEPVFVPCNQCWQCMENKRNDMAGRCLAEMKYSALTVAVTLTFNNDYPREAGMIDPAVWVRWMKRLRQRLARQEHPATVNFLAAAEHGERRGRVHWHAILFFNADDPKGLPAFEYATKYWTWNQWEYGFTWAEKPTQENIRYVTKYAWKNPDKAQRTGNGKIQSAYFTHSKVPIIGAEYFKEHAKEYVRQGLTPRLPFWQITDSTGSKGTLRKLYLSGAAKRLFIATFLTEWKAQRPNQQIAQSDMLEDHFEKQGQQDNLALWREFKEAATHKHQRFTGRLKDVDARVFDDRAISKDRVGQYWLRTYDHFGLATERELRTRGQIRAALRGTLPLEDDEDDEGEG